MENLYKQLHTKITFALTLLLSSLAKVWGAPVPPAYLELGIKLRDS